MAGQKVVSPNNLTEVHYNNETSKTNDTHNEETVKSNFTIVTKGFKEKLKVFVETRRLKAAKKSIVNSLMRKRANNFFISTTSGIFKEQMAEYIADEIYNRVGLEEFIVIVPKLSPEEKVVDIDFQTIFEKLHSSGFNKIILFINDFDKKCEDDEFDLFFDFLKNLKEQIGFEEIRLIATVSIEEFKYDDSHYFEPEMKYDIISITEPEVEEFKNVLKYKILELQEQHQVSISEEIMEYFNLMYIVQNVNNYSMCFYLDTLDAVFSITKSNNREKVRRSDVNEAFYVFFTQDVVVEKNVIKEICYHEAGHCVIAKLVFQNDFKLRALSCIEDSNGLLGTIVGNVKKMEYALDEKIVYQFIAYSLGGMLAEELISATLNLGAEQDLEDAMEVAMEWLLKSGTNSNIGKYCCYNKDEISQKKLEIIEKEATILISKAAEFGKKILTENREFLDMIAGELFKKKLLSERDVDNIYKRYVK